MTAVKRFSAACQVVFLAYFCYSCEPDFAGGTTVTPEIRIKRNQFEEPDSLPFLIKVDHPVLECRLAWGGLPGRGIDQ
jgi:hypothetical protein